MKSGEKHFTLEDGEFVVTGENPEATKYRVFYDGQDITASCLAVVRTTFKEVNEGKKQTFREDRPA